MAETCGHGNADYRPRKTIRDHLRALWIGSIAHVKTARYDNGRNAEAGFAQKVSVPICYVVSWVICLSLHKLGICSSSCLRLLGNKIDKLQLRVNRYFAQWPGNGGGREGSCSSNFGKILY